MSLPSTFSPKYRCSESLHAAEMGGLNARWKIIVIKEQLFAEGRVLRRSANQGAVLGLIAAVLKGGFHAGPQERDDNFLHRDDDFPNRRMRNVKLEPRAAIDCRYSFNSRCAELFKQSGAIHSERHLQQIPVSRPGNVCRALLGKLGGF